MTTNAELDADVHVIDLAEDRLAEAAHVLARSFFHDEPNHVHVYPNEDVREWALPCWFVTIVRDALSFGHVYAATCEGDIVGVAVWYPPETFPLPLWREFRVVVDMRRLLTAPQSALRLVRFLDRLEELHPAQPYWYLPYVGVEPAMQGQGIGTRLLEPILAQADEEKLPCYLETATERNVAWYRKLGFEIRNAEDSVISGGPQTWTMLR